MTNIAILGAGGKMGCRLTENLLKSPSKHTLLLVEVSEAGRSKISERGLKTTDEMDALSRADVIILALPDRILDSTNTKAFGWMHHARPAQPRPSATRDPHTRIFTFYTVELGGSMRDRQLSAR